MEHPPLHISEPDLSTTWFPTNITLEDAREAVAGRVDFKETKSDDYYSFVYFLGMAPDIFPDPETAVDERTKYLWAVRRELRGLIFDENGKVISRRFHKFFNIGELPESRPELIDLSQPFTILEKLDGSMIGTAPAALSQLIPSITPFFSMGQLRFCTKSGVTDTSDMAEKFVETSPFNYKGLSEAVIKLGYSPIYEYCSPASRIVLEYKEESLSLLALRHMETGRYVSFTKTKDIGEKFGVPVVKAWSLGDFEYGGDMNVLFDAIRKKSGVEGFVIRFDSGKLYKVKTHWYFSFHRTVNFLKFYGERHVWEAVLNETYDDAKPFLPNDIREAIDRFANDLLNNIRHKATKLIAQVEEGFAAYPDSRDFGRNVVSKHDGHERQIMWDIFETVKANKAPELPSVVQRIVKTVLALVTSKKALSKATLIVGDISYETYRPKSNQRNMNNPKTNTPPDQEN